MIHTLSMESSVDVRPVRSKKIEQGDATREALVAAARELFGAQGYAAAPLGPKSRVSP